MPLIGHPPLEKPSLCFCLLCVAGEVAFLAPTQRCASSARPCLGFLFVKKLLWQEDSRWNWGKGRKRERCPGLVFCRSSLRLL